MFGFGVGDWVFIILIFITIMICVGLSGLFRKRK
jgi:hypothetical protein